MIIQFALHHLIKLNSQCRTLDTKTRCVSPFDYFDKVDVKFIVFFWEVNAHMYVFVLLAVGFCPLA